MQEGLQGSAIPGRRSDGIVVVQTRRGELARVGKPNEPAPAVPVILIPETQSVGLAGSPAWKVFAEIRERKNRF